MAAHKGHPKSGGRKKGTPNRTTSELKANIAALLDTYFAEGNPDQLTARTDLRDMTPTDRIKAFIALASFVIPKQQSVSVEEQTRIETDALLTFLQTAPDEAIDAIAEKVLEMQTQNRKDTGHEE